jgi:oxygen-independent coproporphyrinogen-3 oxidase
LFIHLHNLIRSAFPEYSIVQEEDSNQGDNLTITSQTQGDHWLFSGRVCTQGKETVLQLKSNELAGKDKPLSYHAQIFLYRLLCLHTGVIFNSYGILTGVRPVKIVHRLKDLGLSGHDIKTILEREYLILPEKCDLLLEVASANRPYLLAREQTSNHISLYIGVPFCPSRCYYCSFPAAEVRDYPRQVSPFVDALAQEMSIIGKYVASRGLQIQSVYLGGGTPTILAKADLDRIFTLLHRYFL